MSSLLRLALAGALFFVLFQFDLIDLASLARLADDLPAMLLALALLLLIMPVSAARWHALLHCQGFKPTLGKVVQITFIGQFFNVFLPGSWGGDAVRLGYLYRAARTALSRLLFSLVLDRAFGLLVLIFIGLAVMLSSDRRSAPLYLLLLAVSLAILVVATLLFARRGEWIVGQLRGLRFPLTRRLHSFAREVHGGLRLYIGSPRTLLWAALLSSVNILCSLAALQIIYGTMGIGNLSWSENVVVGAISLITNAVPLTPGGLGLGEAGYSHFANSFDDGGTVVAYGTIFLAFRALQAVAGLPGAVLFLLYRNDVMEYIHMAPKAKTQSLAPAMTSATAQSRRNSE